MSTKNTIQKVIHEKSADARNYIAGARTSLGEEAERLQERARTAREEYGYVVGSALDEFRTQIPAQVRSARADLEKALEGCSTKPCSEPVAQAIRDLSAWLQTQSDTYAPIAAEKAAPVIATVGLLVDQYKPILDERVQAAVRQSKLTLQDAVTMVYAPAAQVFVEMAAVKAREGNLEGAIDAISTLKRVSEGKLTAERTEGLVRDAYRRGIDESLAGSKSAVDRALAGSVASPGFELYLKNAGLLAHDAHADRQQVQGMIDYALMLARLAVSIGTPEGALIARGCVECVKDFYATDNILKNTGAKVPNTSYITRRVNAILGE